MRGGATISRGRGILRGGGFSGRGAIQKPPPLMSRPMPPPNEMRHGLHGPGGPPPRPMMSMITEFRRMGPPRLPPPGPPSRGPPNLRMGSHNRGPRPLIRGIIPTQRLRGHSGLLPPPLPPLPPLPGPPGPRIFRHHPPVPPGMMGPMGMRGRGMPGRILRGGMRGRGGHVNRGGSNNRKGGKTPRGRGAKGKVIYFAHIYFKFHF